jgi:hypothetical protein
MLSKHEALANYGDLKLHHARSEDSAFRYVFTGTADDGARVQVIHSSNMYIWEDYVRPEQSMTMKVEPDYHLIQIMRNGELVYEEYQAVEY